MDSTQPIYTNNIYKQANSNLPPHSTAQEQSNRKRTKKDRACDLCRRKKIRCDFDSTYPQNPCTSCRSYNKTCAFEEAAKKRGPPKGYVEGLENRLKRMEELLMNIAGNGNLPPETLKGILQAKDEGAEDESDSVKSSSSPHSENYSSQQLQRQHDDEDTVMKPPADIIECSESEPYSYVGSSSGIYLINRLFAKSDNNCNDSNVSTPSSLHSSPSSIQTPKQIKALPRPLEGHEDDLMIARTGIDSMSKLGMGKLTTRPDWKLPQKELVDELLDIYFEKFNPMLPILDEDSFRDTYNNSHGYSETFVPIIMTLCRITCRTLKKDDLLVKKYKINRTELIDDIKSQMTLYFDLDFLEPKIETIQVLLLNAANAEKWGLESSDWITTSIAVKMAQDLGLHRANTQHAGIPKEDTEAKKRLWWSAYIIDRWVCASLGRPLTISDADCDVGDPDPEDPKYTLFVQMVKLSCILGDVLRALCSPRARLMSEKGVDLENISRNLEQKLFEWRNSLPKDLNMTDHELSRISQNNLDPKLEKKLNNGAGKLIFAYCAVYLLSKRPLISLGMGYASTVRMPIECFNAIKLSVDLFSTIKEATLLSGWSMTAYCISQMQILLFLNYRNADDNVVAEAKRLVERSTNRHEKLENYIAEPIVPFIGILSKLIAGDGKAAGLKNNLNEVERSHNLNTASPADGVNSGDTAENHHDPNAEMSLWGTTSGIEWQEIVKLLADSGYNI